MAQNQALTSNTLTVSLPGVNTLNDGVLVAQSFGNVDFFAVGRTDRGLLVVLVGGEQITVSKSSPDAFLDKAVEHIRQQARRVAKARRAGAAGS